MTEPRTLAYAFSETDSREDLQETAGTLSARRRDNAMGWSHARKVAAALRRLAQEPWR